MPEPPQELLAAVRDQAEARVRMDVQGYAKYLTPDGVESLRASFPGVPPRVSLFEIVAHRAGRIDHVFDVRYAARDVAFVVRSRWRQVGGRWMVVHAERLWADGERRPGTISRLLGSLLGRLGGLRR